jgi:hypothetical protein
VFKYRIEIFSQGKWLDRGQSIGRHAQEAIRNAGLADKTKLPRRATLLTRSDYRSNEGLSSVVVCREDFVPKAYGKGNRLVETTSSAQPKWDEKTSKQLHAEWYRVVDSQPAC